MIEFNIKDHKDNRGFFKELYNLDRYNIECKQVNCSFSCKNTVRGIHVAPFGKLVICLQGKIFDVMVENNSWESVILSNNKQVYIPPNCGHGFMALENSLVVYMQTGTYDPETETSINWRDKTLNIDWPLVDEYIVSEKDRNAPFI